MNVSFARCLLRAHSCTFEDAAAEAEVFFSVFQLICLPVSRLVVNFRALLEPFDTGHGVTCARLRVSTKMVALCTAATVYGARSNGGLFDVRTLPDGTKGGHFLL